MTIVKYILENTPEIFDVLWKSKFKYVKSLLVNLNSLGSELF